MNDTNNEEVFKIRAYGFGELAQLYFPNIAKKSATWQFRKWINANDSLYKRLECAGLRPKVHILTPAQVKIIIEFIGEP